MMTGHVERGWPSPALAAAGIGVAAAWAGGIAGFVTALLAAGTIVIAYGRGRGWSVSRSLERPRFFAILSIVYLPIFLVDFTLALRTNLVPALIHLVVFLLVAEGLSGNTTRSHRVLLFGLLLLVATASETTDIWFAFPLVAFAAAAVLTLMRATLQEHQPTGIAFPQRLPWSPVAGIVAGSVAIGGVLFLAIPRMGVGWGRQVGGKASEANLETGLADAVNLGMVGQVKQRRRVAFTARLRGVHYDPESIYWRGRSYSRWTGGGWIKEQEHEVSVDLKPGEAKALPGETLAGIARDPHAEIEMKLDRPPIILTPGRPVWVRAPWLMRLLISSDGGIRASHGRAPRRYDIGVKEIGTGRRAQLEDPEPAGPGAADQTECTPEDTASEIHLDAGDPEPRIRTWAAGIAANETDPRRIARAFVADLSSRPYSLDTRAIDIGHPIASFLDGAPAHCEYFASAMTLGLRLRGIPARVVGGYLGAEHVPLSETLVVRESRAHLWVEAFMPGEGWTTFDPTPEAGRSTPSEIGYMLRGTWERLVMSWDAMVIGLDIGDQADLLLSARDALFGLWSAAREDRTWILSGLGLAAAALAAWLVRWHVRRSRTRRGVPGGIPGYYRRFLAEARRRNCHPEPPETAREFAARVAPLMPHPKAVWLLNRFYERERFGGAPPNRSEGAEIQAALDLLSS